MRGKLWDELSSAYRARLSKAGISQREHNAAVRSGKGLAKRTAARGHSQTPERPSRANTPSNRQKYVEYRARRASIVDRVVTAKRRIFADTRKFNATANIRYVEKNPVTEKSPPIAKLEEFLTHYELGDFDEWWDEVKDDDDYAFLYYH